MPMHQRTTLSRWTVSLPVAALVAATLAASPLSAQAPAAAAPARYVPTQYLGVGLTQLSANGTSSTYYSALYGMGFKKLYASVAFNLYSESGVTASANDYQIGYLFMHKQPEPKKGAMGLAVAGGLWHPDEGDMSPMLAANLFGALGKTSRFLGTLMIGQIFPEGGDGVTTFRVGLGYTL